MTANVFLFAGPSMAALTTEFDLDGVTLLPPAKRGDIRTLVDEHKFGVILLVDGVFFHTPAVGHSELLHAMQQGWPVWGASSIGAIRAYELREHNMRGFGRVFAEFFKHDDLGDDEMALLHSPEPHYWPITEALINIRLFLQDQIKEDNLSSEAANQVITEMKNLYFGDRTIEQFACLLKKYQVDDVENLLQRYCNTQVKSQDLLNLLRDQPWKREFTYA